MIPIIILITADFLQKELHLPLNFDPFACILLPLLALGYGEIEGVAASGNTRRGWNEYRRWDGSEDRGVRLTPSATLPRGHDAGLVSKIGGET
jgi:hypothetical protein